MQAVPNSSAMDAAAGGAGPGTQILPWIAGAEPRTVLTYAADLMQRMARLAGLFAELNRLKGSLGEAWTSGAAADAADRKLTAGIESFQRIAPQVEGGAAQLRSAATMLQLFQAAYRAVVGAVNPTVAALMSNPYTRGAATSLAVSTTSSLRGYLGGVRASLDVVALTNIVQVVKALASIAQEVEGLLSGRESGTQPTAGPLPTAPPPAQPDRVGPQPAPPTAGRGSVVMLPDGRLLVTLPGAQPGVTASAVDGPDNTWIPVKP